MERKKQNKTTWQKLQAFLAFDPWAASQKGNFFETIATMMVSGIDIRTILIELQKEAKSKYLQTMIADILVEVENGTPLWRVIEYHGLVPDYYIALIRIGEQSGNLPRNLEIVVKQLEQDREFRDQIRSASLYPSIVGALLVVVTFGLMTFVIPKIGGVYSSLKVELPLITRIMLGIGDFLSGNVVLSVVVFALLMILSIYIFYINKTTKKIVQQIVFKMPGLGRILQEAEIARMGSVLSSLIKSGIGLTESIKLLESATQLTAYRKFYKFISYYLEKGYTLELIFVSYAGISKLLPLYPRQLILNGEKSCTLDSSFERVSEIYAKKNQLSLKDINTIFEPVMMIIVFIGVAIFSISVILPIYSILGNITDLSSGNSVNQAPQINNQTTKNTNLNTDVNKLK